jgi:hypothetical protein
LGTEVIEVLTDVYTAVVNIEANHHQREDRSDVEKTTIIVPYLEVVQQQKTKDLGDSTGRYFLGIGEVD